MLYTVLKHTRNKTISYAGYSYSHNFAQSSQFSLWQVQSFQLELWSVESLSAEKIYNMNAQGEVIAVAEQYGKDLGSLQFKNIYLYTDEE